MKQFRILLWGLVAFAVAGLTWFTLSQTAPGSSGGFSTDFDLVDTRGNPVDGNALRGRPHLIFFGFTHCPEVCPTTLFEVTGWYNELGKDGDLLDAYFISVDPERDTAELLENYVANFDPRIKALTGSVEEIEKATKAYHVFYKKVPLDDGDYTVDHTASVFLMKADGSFKGTISYQENSEIALEKVRNLLKS